MPQLTKEWIDRLKHKQEHTWVAKTASGTIVIAHPGQVPPDPRDRKTLRQEFGLLDDVPVQRLIDTDESSDFDRLYAELDRQESSASTRKAYYLSEYIKAALEEAREMGLPATPAIVREAETEAAQALTAAQATGADGDGTSGDEGGADEAEQSVTTVGGRRRAAAKE